MDGCHPHNLSVLIIDKENAQVPTRGSEGAAGLDLRVEPRDYLPKGLIRNLGKRLDVIEPLLDRSRLGFHRHLARNSCVVPGRGRLP